MRSFIVVFLVSGRNGLLPAVADSFTSCSVGVQFEEPSLGVITSLFNGTAYVSTHQAVGVSP